MFERMEITESIYKGVVEPPYKKTTWENSNPTGHRRKKREKSASSWTHPKKGESAGKRKKKHVDFPTGKSKTCLIHSPGNSS